MSKKYELITNVVFKNVSYNTSYRIRALNSFGNVKAGDLGGYIESEHNLGDEGNCWVSGNARVFRGATVCGHAHVYGNAQVSGGSWVYECAQVYGNAEICGVLTYVSGDVHICGDAYVHALPHGIFLGGNVKLDHGVWSQSVIINYRYYLISSTLEKISSEYYYE